MELFLKKLSFTNVIGACHNGKLKWQLLFFWWEKPPFQKTQGWSVWSVVPDSSKPGAGRVAPGLPGKVELACFCFWGLRKKLPHTKRGRVELISVPTSGSGATGGARMELGVKSQLGVNLLGTSRELWCRNSSRRTSGSRDKELSPLQALGPGAVWELGWGLLKRRRASGLTISQRGWRWETRMLLPLVSKKKCQGHKAIKEAEGLKRKTLGFLLMTKGLWEENRVATFQSWLYRQFLKLLVHLYLSRTTE